MQDHLRGRRLRAAPAGLLVRHRGPGHRGTPPAPSPGRYADKGGYTADHRDAFPNPADTDAKPLPAPAGATYVWDFILDYAIKHPRDPRVPEALHWIIHLGRYGQGHNHSGKRAFTLLKSCYPASPWAKQNQFYYD